MPKICGYEIQWDTTRENPKKKMVGIHMDDSLLMDFDNPSVRMRDLGQNPRAVSETAHIKTKKKKTGHNSQSGDNV